MRIAPFLLAATLVFVPKIDKAYAEDTTVFTASSFAPALKALSKSYSARYPRDQIVIVPAASSSLVRQIIAGAPADILITAHDSWLKHAIESNHIDTSSVRVVATNKLVLAVNRKHATSHRLVEPHRPAEPQRLVEPQGSLSHGFPLADILRDSNSRLAIGDPGYVPSGYYAKEALQTLGMWQSVLGLLAPMADARSVVNLVSRGETVWAIVYGSDLIWSPDIEGFGTFPASSHTPIRYFAAPIATRANESSRRFFSYLQSPDAREILDKLGFCPDCQ